MLVVVNLASFFIFLIVSLAFPRPTFQLMGRLMFVPDSFLHGALWQAITYSFIHPPGVVVGTLFELLSIWFLVGFLESIHGTNWVTSLYTISVLGAAAAGLAIDAGSGTLGYTLLPLPLYGCMGGIFGLLTAFGLLYGDMQVTLFPLPFSMKARTMALIYVLVALALLYGQERMLAFSMLGGALAGVVWVRLAPRQGIRLKFKFAFSESWYGMRNRYYRWKRRRAARKFEVYMREQGRTVKFDGQGHLIDEDNDDKKRWN